MDKIFKGPCDFIAGVATLDRMIEPDLPEVAFAGRSNVGKSSLINTLTNRKDLARTSKTPGRTQQLNFFNLGDVFYLVDMPGYGYAKVSKKQRKEWDYVIGTYLRGRVTLRCVFVLVDGRHGFKDSDDKIMSMLDEAAVPYRIVFTKCDKVSGKDLKALEETVAAVLKKHPAAFPECIYTSAVKNDGMDELRDAILTVVQ